MVLRPEPLFAALEAIDTPHAHIICMTPQGRPFDQATAQRLATAQHLIFICGHYEGIDQRVIEHWVDEELSIGDYVLTNGAIAAAIVIDAVVRLLPGALGDDQSAIDESFGPSGLLEAPQYTKPAEFRGQRVPDILLSGNHAKISTWRQEQALAKTREVRPDLLSQNKKPTPR
jgi:tRNA (guanine37-N1)-methyltransferase